LVTIRAHMAHDLLLDSQHAGDPPHVFPYQLRYGELIGVAGHAGAALRKDKHLFFHLPPIVAEENPQSSNAGSMVHLLSRRKVRRGACTGHHVYYIAKKPYRQSCRKFSCTFISWYASLHPGPVSAYCSRPFYRSSPRLFPGLPRRPHRSISCGDIDWMVP